jgi:hypothetical protein
MAIASVWPSPPDIFEYYRRSIEALTALKLGTAGAVSVGSRFEGMTQDDVRVALDNLRNDLDQSVVLLLEATLQADFHETITRKKKDGVSKELRKLWYGNASKHGRSRRVTVEEIVDVWKKHIGQTFVIGNFKQLVLYRHWLAHGRYWVQKSGLLLIDPFDAWQRGAALFNVLPGFQGLMASWQQSDE